MHVHIHSGPFIRTPGRTAIIWRFYAIIWRFYAIILRFYAMIQAKKIVSLCHAHTMITRRGVNESTGRAISDRIHGICHVKMPSSCYQDPGVSECENTIMHTHMKHTQSTRKWHAIKLENTQKPRGGAMLTRRLCCG
jgi:hypothetical protein